MSHPLAWISLVTAEEPNVNLTTRSRIIAAVAAVFFFLLVLELVRRRKLQERYTVLWFVLAIGMLAGAAFPTLLELLANLIGVRDTNVALFALLLLLLLALAFESTITASKQGEQITRLAQENALLKVRQGNPDSHPSRDPSVEDALAAADDEPSGGREPPG